MKKTLISTKIQFFLLTIIIFFILFQITMPHFLRGEVARLVLSYTLEENLTNTTNTFLKESTNIPLVGGLGIFTIK